MATANNYIPETDESFDGWQSNFMTEVATMLVALGLVPADLTGLLTEQTTWVNAYAVGSKAVKGSRSATQVKNKNLARGAYEKSLRLFVANHINKNVNLTDGNRVTLGVNVPSARTKAVKPTSTPVNANAKNNQHLFIGLDVRDENSPSSRKKPAGVKSYQVFGLVVPFGQPAPSVLKFAFLGVFTRFNGKMSFAEENTGQILYFRLCWVNAVGEFGAWSVVYNVMIM